MTRCFEVSTFVPPAVLNFDPTEKKNAGKINELDTAKRWKNFKININFPDADCDTHGPE